MAGILTALLSGALMSIQGSFNTEVTKQTSTWLAAGWADQCVCRPSCGNGASPGGSPSGSVPRKAVVSAARRAIGAFITITVIWSMAGPGPAKAAMLIVISQLCSGVAD